MNILLINIDSKLPNLALHRVAEYHKNKGHSVTWDMPLMRHCSDVIYASCIFSWNYHKAEEWADYGAIVGGTGYNVYSKLSSEIEATPCRINYGFTTRGCIRNCPFCVVPESEGYIRVVGDIYDVWDGKSREITLMDNNILALPEHFKLIAAQVIAEGLYCDFNQGLDHRILTPEICDLLVKIKHRVKYRFAFDDERYEGSVRKAIRMLDKAGLRFNTWYIFVDAEMGVDSALRRIDMLKGLDQTPYLMRHESVYHLPEYIQLARWCNQPAIMRKMTFAQFNQIKLDRK